MTAPEGIKAKASGRNVLRFLLMLSVFIFCAAPVRSVTPTTDPTLKASIITCWPGPEIYELCGHAALRIKGEGIDSVWNYGVFDFREPHFVYRFVKGQTDYMVAGYPFSWFMPEYVERGSKVVEQELNLTPAETARLRQLLQTEALPENRKYRYNYVLDNCATRIIDRVGDATGDNIQLTGTPRYGTFRNEMRAYHRDYPWYQFGIDVALGSGLDVPIGVKREMFVPVEMAARLDSAHWSDGRPVVAATRILYEGRPGATLPPDAWWQTPLFWSFVALALSIAVALGDWLRKKLSRWWYSLWFGLLGLAGCLVAFLVFASSHEATSPNILLLWLNPLQLVVAVCVWWKGTRPLALAMAVVDVITTVCLLVGWAFQPQSANPAFFPLMGATLVSAAAYAAVSYAIMYGPKGYNKTGLSDFAARESRGHNPRYKKRKQK